MSAGTDAPDVIDALAGIGAGSDADALRRARPAARENAQLAHTALFAPTDASRMSVIERHAIAAWTAALAGAAATAEPHRRALAEAAPDVDAALETALPEAAAIGPYGAYPPGPLSIEDEDGPHWTASAPLRAAVGGRLAAALEHAHLLTYRPRDADRAALGRLGEAGWSDTGIVTLSQLVSFVHFQLRVVAGLRALQEA
nr:CMD domain protein [Microbacterium bovistercoris]